MYVAFLCCTTFLPSVPNQSRTFSTDFHLGCKSSISQWMDGEGTYHKFADWLALIEYMLTLLQPICTIVPIHKASYIYFYLYIQLKPHFHQSPCILIKTHIYTSLLPRWCNHSAWEVPGLLTIFLLALHPKYSATLSTYCPTILFLSLSLQLFNSFWFDRSASQVLLNHSIQLLHH